VTVYAESKGQTTLAASCRAKQPVRPASEPSNDLHSGVCRTKRTVTGEKIGVSAYVTQITSHRIRVRYKGRDAGDVYCGL
jgi:hypothetical protein